MTELVCVFLFSVTFNVFCTPKEIVQGIEPIEVIAVDYKDAILKAVESSPCFDKQDLEGKVSVEKKKMICFTVKKG